jgi:uncharacterized NAD(P)/FAD-binding protein YdhS/predicted metal-dependent enzyme (double-stranded beta helix superfamily)
LVDLPAALHDLAQEIDSRRDHTPASLAALLRRPISIDDIGHAIRFDPGNYVRSLVTRGERWELRLLCWQPGQTSSLHGHGGAACAFRVLRGSAVESILGSRDRVWAPGDVVAEDGLNLVHQVGNAGADALLSLHAYSPPLPVDAPSPRSGRDVVIVGGGLSGVAVAIHLLHRADRDLRIMLVERGPWLGRGIAYGVDSKVFRLNVPAAKMSIDPEKPDDFVTWAGAEADPNAFLSRSLYGSYVVQRFNEALRTSHGKLRLIRAEAHSVEKDAVLLTDGTRLPAEVVVLATGLAPRLAPSALPADARIFDAWDECALATIPRDGKILILGAGLTALDVLAVLEARRFSGRATILSRRGLLPRPHLAPLRPAAPLRPELTADLPKDLRALLAWGRGVVAETVDRGDPWQHAIDAMRPHITKLWRELPPKDRARFARSVRPYWEVLRHRAPADAHALVEAWRVKGRLRVEAGSVMRCQPGPDGLDVEIRRSGGGARTERYDTIVRCIGPALERAEAEAPLVRELIETGEAAADPAGLGIATDDEGRVVMPDGKTQPGLYAIGALRRASSWETTAVPDISVHALAIARCIVR